MAKDQKKIAKRKEEVKKKLQLQRTSLTKARQDEANALKSQKAARKAEIENQRMEVWAESIAAKLPEATRRQIEHNIEILKALEEEYEAEMSAKLALNQKLEAEGCVTFEEKLRGVATLTESTSLEELEENQETENID